MNFTAAEFVEEPCVYGTKVEVLGFASFFHAVDIFKHPFQTGKVHTSQGSKNFVRAK